MKLKFLLIGLFICTFASAQNFIMKKKLADRYYSRFDYYRAIPMYEQLLKSFPQNYEIYDKLADSYRRINDSQNAERYYAILVDSSANKHEYLLYYAQALARNGKYDKAITWYQKYYKAEPGDTRGRDFAVAYQNIASLYKDSNSYSIRKMPFCTEASDFSPAYFGKGIVFASARPKFSLVRFFYNWTYSSFLNLYFASPDSAVAIPFSKKLNSVYHEGPVTFNKNQDTILFTRSNFYHWRFGKSNEGINKLKLFQANWDPSQKEWVNIIPMPFNNDQYSVGHPALSPNGQDLYFSSDMPGGFGGTDIYVSHWITDSLGKKNWGKPTNLGAEINSQGNEMFPFMDRDGNLWFASNGLPGLGGLDVFVARKTMNGFAKPINLGFPINTRFDDFGYITQTAGKEAYISSDRFGSDDILKIKRISRNLVLWVLDAKTKQGLSAATIVISAKGTEPENKITDANGFAKLVMKQSNAYQFVATKDKYEDCKIEFSKDKLEDLDTIKLVMIKQLIKIQLNGKVFSADNQNAIGNASVYLINKVDSSKIETKSDEKGVFHFDLLPESDYIIKVVVTAASSKCSANTIVRSTRGMVSDVIFNESFPVFCVGDVIKVENIYYDLGKYNIRSDAALELDKLLDIMNKYPNMKIELRSHTDSRGTPVSNMTLSGKRAKAAAEYLFSKGIARDRIIGKGYGDTMPLNQCVKGVKCSEDDYKVNRRTEFKILSIE
jgi:outer membrane protein OmpA-like peptidoglycan-associated protein/tetratricopeptide (TPR) repeat protein